jgi:hypothetical protein
MAIVNKAEFARIMGVHKSQVTRWARAGMPVLPGGGVDSDVAARWVRRAVDPTQRAIRSRIKRAHTAAATVLPQPPGTEHLTDPVDGAVVTALPMLAERMPAVATVIARVSGADEAVARALYAAMKTAVAQEVARALDRLDVPAPRGSEGWDGATLCDWAEVNWTCLAAPAGKA